MDRAQLSHGRTPSSYLLPWVPPGESSVFWSQPFMSAGIGTSGFGYYTSTKQRVPDCLKLIKNNDKQRGKEARDGCSGSFWNGQIGSGDPQLPPSLFSPCKSQLVCPQAAIKVSSPDGCSNCASVSLHASTLVKSAMESRPAHLEGIFLPSQALIYLRLPLPSPPCRISVLRMPSMGTWGTSYSMVFRAMCSTRLTQSLKHSISAAYG